MAESRSLHALVMAHDVAGVEALLRERNGALTCLLATSITHSLTHLFIDCVNEYDTKQRTPLHLACWLGELEMIQILLNAGASCALLAQDGFTCLHFAVQKLNENALNIVKLLLKTDKTLLNKKVFKGKKSVLHLAISKNNYDVVQHLLESGKWSPLLHPFLITALTHSFQCE